MAVKQADLSSIELPAEFADINVQQLQDVSDALQAAADAALLAAEADTDPAQWRRLSLATLTSTVSRTAIETIMRVTNIHPTTLKLQLQAALAVNEEHIAHSADNTTHAVKVAVAASEKAVQLTAQAVQHLDAVINA